jgi:hypothetical protein
MRLNGQDVKRIRLEPAAQPLTRDEIVRLSTVQLRQYANMLTFALDSEPAGATAHSTPFASIEPESTIDLRGLPHSVAQPQLGLVVEAGYPFTAYPDLSGTAIVLSNRPTAIEYETLLNMVGFFGAQTGATVTGVTIVDAAHVDGVRDKDLVVLGASMTQPLLATWSTIMPLSLTRIGPMINGAARSTQWLHAKWPFADGDRERLARLIGAGYTFDAVLQQFASPYRSDRSVVVIVPGDDGGALAASTFFASRNGPVYGGVAVGRTGRFESFRLGVGTYRAGRADWNQRALVLLFDQYWLIAPLVLAAALVIGRIMSVGTERLAARRLAG